MRLVMMMTITVVSSTHFSPIRRTLLTGRHTRQDLFPSRTYQDQVHGVR